jgi:hypothetical protein
MERVRVLIQKLQQQSAENEDAASLLATVRELAAELGSLAPRPSLPSGGRVAVVLPQSYTKEAPLPAALPIETRAPEPPALLIPQTISEVPPIEIPPAPQPAPAPVQQPEELPFNALEDVPTLAQQTPREVRELHVGSSASLHEKLKTNEPELAARHTGSPIKDLRKGIGINDRFLFISELFRGDEVMYERSIKTINAFHILAEAEYWINRELKVKLGWDDSIDTVQHFYGLVRRRFS